MKDLNKLDLLYTKFEKNMIEHTVKDSTDLKEKLLQNIDRDRLDVFQLLDVFQKFDMEDQILFIEHYFSCIYLQYDKRKELTEGIRHFEFVHSCLKTMARDMDRLFDEDVKKREFENEKNSR